MVALHAAGWLLLVLAALGSLYTLAAAFVMRRFFAARDRLPARRSDAVTILKPLHGAEPLLGDNLVTFVEQNHDGPIQMLCGVHGAADAALAAAQSLRVVQPDRRIETVIDSRTHGANGKIANLINLEHRIAHSIVVLSDSDIVAGPDYLARLLAALGAPGVGAVTCLYRGRGDAGFWSRVGAAQLSYQFLPGAVFGVATGMATPCMGSTIALRRETLDRIGGFGRFADVLADDYAIGEAVRALGLTVAVPPMLVVHASVERSFGELWKHELRWNATIRGIGALPYAASVIAMPLPLALIGALLSPGIGAAAICAAALAARLILRRAVDEQAGAVTAPAWLLPVRDLLTFAVFLAGFFVRSVDWRGDRLRMRDRGTIEAEAELSG
ncbi:hopanoid biosynthesis associated glucosyltransferase [Sphingomonas changbaiensis NBRC 104936]|uniref:Hopanoid biosynthesis associated glucosyltransferase n=1 Tax=Sphingomonas changbaiensis NBRC 104936 TaxID=1219043 RepID=A0A0E9MR45_9SPHN|nr:bacteriohopanetetrol glucosamine biosynthesis glycosyltransferase HpnI [Sphingomonas changbaiensis]GAO40257.1 hopanoid biosynthesis associated glucosyltransferase [Sphingomonas changbaiensis NBRC 104936]